MSILNYIERIKRENEGPRITAQEPRNMYAGGQLVRNTADGSRPGYNGDKYRRGYPLKQGSKFDEGFKWALQVDKGNITGTEYFKKKKEMTDYVDAKVRTRKKLSKVPPKSELNKAAAYYNSLPKDHPLYISSSNYDDLKWTGREKRRVYERVVDFGGKFKIKTQAKEFSKTDKAKILKAYPDAKFTVKNTYGFSPDDAKYDEVWRFVNERNFKKSYKKLPKYAQKQLEDAFPSVKFNWEGKVNMEFLKTYIKPIQTFIKKYRLIWMTLNSGDMLLI